MNLKYTVKFIILLLLFLTGAGNAAQKKTPIESIWLFRTDLLDEGVSEKWFDLKYDRSSWKEVNVPDYWERYHGMESYDGAGWFAYNYEVKDTSKSLSIYFGGVDDDAEVWINGIKVGSHSGYSEPFSFPIDKAVKQGRNLIVVRVNDNSGPGGIYKPVVILPTGELDQMFKTKYSELEARNRPDWVQNAVIYEVYLRSFSKEGTFKALEQRISELDKLGVNVIWLMPIHPTGKKFRKGSLGSPYSVKDYYSVNPEFGTFDDFKSLVNSVHRKGMKIIIDLVANHTAWDNRMLKEHPEWYSHDSNGKIVSPNPDWTDVADLNYDSPELRKYMMAVMKYWIHDIGIDGFRCDVAELVPTDFWESAVAELDSIKPVLMLSEGTLPEHHVKAFNITYSWNFYDALGKVINDTTPASIFNELLKTESYQFPKKSLRMRFISNHDKNVWDSPAIDRYGPLGLKTATVLVFTYPGIPLIFNGDEAGNDKRLDLFEKVNIDWTRHKEYRKLHENLAMIRKNHQALISGSYSALQNNDCKKVLSFMRVKGEDSLMVVLNLGPAVQCSISSGSSSEWKDLFSNEIFKFSDGKCIFELPAMDYKILSPHQ